MKLLDRYRGSYNAKFLIPGIAWFFVMAILLFLPGSDLPQEVTWLDLIYFDKLVHSGIFFIAGILFCLPVMLSTLPVAAKRMICYLIVGLFIGWGILTEFLQLWFVPGRSFDIFDWFADSVGIVLGYLASVYLAHKV